MRRLLVSFSLLLSVAAISEPLRFISLPGAGIAGLVQIRLLDEIEAQTGLPIAKQVERVAGTGAGAIIAASLCIGQKGTQTPLFNLPHYRSSYIADAREIMNLTKILLRTADGVMDGVIQREFGNAYMSQALCKLSIDSYHRHTQSDVVFDSVLAQSPDYDLPVWQAIRASSSMDVIPGVGFPFSSGVVRYNTSQEIGGFSDPGLHRVNDITSLLVAQIRKDYPGQESVVYVLGSGREPSSTTTDGTITVVRIEPNFDDAKEPMLTPFRLDMSDDNIAYIDSRAEAALHSAEFKRMLSDFTQETSCEGAVCVH